MAKAEDIAKLVSEQIKQTWVNKVENFIVNSDQKMKDKINTNQIQPSFYSGQSPEQVAINLLNKKGD